MQWNWNFRPPVPWDEKKLAVDPVKCREKLKKKAKGKRHCRPNQAFQEGERQGGRSCITEGA